MRPRTRFLPILAAALIGAALTRPALAQEAPPSPEEHGPSLFDEPGLMTAALNLAGKFTSSGEGEGEDDDGFYPKVSGMISGAGWISGGPGYRRHVLQDRAVIDVFGAVSWRGFLEADAVFEFPLLADGRLTAGVEALWRDSTQLNYFGIGPDTLDLRSQYRLQSMNVVGYGRYRSSRWFALSASLGWLDHPSISSATGPFKPDDLDAQTTFPDDPAMTLAVQPRFFHGETAVTADTRDHNDHPTRGALYRASAGAYVADQDRFSFRRYEVEGLQVFPMFDRAWIVALHGWGAFSDVPEGHEVPFYMLPSLGGGNTLRGFSNYRFHDRHLLLATAESRWPIFPHMDAAVFLDTGTVAPRVRDLGLDETVYGFGFRIHQDNATLARLDIAHNAEGWQVLFRSSDPFNLKRLTRWTAAIPFVP